MSNTPHRCVVGLEGGYDPVFLYEGDTVDAERDALWDYCPECGRRHGAADQAAAAAALAKERALAALPPIAPDEETWGRALEYVWAAQSARLRGLDGMARGYESYVREMANRALLGFAPRK